jgi:hypothetical protein
MSLLDVLVAAVNTVADWPDYECWAADDAISRTIGFLVGPDENLVGSWQMPLRNFKRDMIEVEAKRTELKWMQQRVKPLPLDPWPADEVAREVHVRLALLNSAVGIMEAEARRHTAWWVTFLGRMHAGWGPFDRGTQRVVEPLPDPGGALDAFGLTIQGQVMPAPNGAVFRGILHEAVYANPIRRLIR